MEKYSFFDSIEGEDEREYSADEFAEYFRQVISTGILNGGENLQVTCSGTNMTLQIKEGYAWIEGYLYKIESEPLEIELDTADPALDRIDRIVIRLDKRLEHRYIQAFVLKGVPGESPVVGELSRDDNVFEIAIAQVRVSAGKSFVEASQITDERLNSEVCGLANSLITADTTEIFNRFESWFQEKTNDVNGTFYKEWKDWINEVKGASYMSQSQADERYTNQAEFDQLETKLKGELSVFRTSPKDTGTVNAMSIDASFDLTVPDNVLNVTPANTNTGATTISINSVIKSIKKFDIDKNVFVELEEEDIKKNTPIQLTWDKELDFFVFAPKGAKLEEIQSQNVEYNCSLVEDFRGRKEIYFDLQSIECNDKYIVACNYLRSIAQNTITVLDAKTMDIVCSFKTSYWVMKQGNYQNDEMAIAIDNAYDTIYTIEQDGNDPTNRKVVKYNITGEKIWEKSYKDVNYPYKYNDSVNHLQSIHKIGGNIMVTASLLRNVSFGYWYIHKDTGNWIKGEYYDSGYAAGGMAIFPTNSKTNQMFIGAHSNYRWVGQSVLNTVSQTNDSVSNTSRFKLNTSMFDYIRIPYSSSSSNQVTIKPKNSASEIYINLYPYTQNGYLYRDNFILIPNRNYHLVHLLTDFINYQIIQANAYGSLKLLLNNVRPRVNKYGIYLVATNDNSVTATGKGLKRFVYKTKINL